MIEVVKLLAPYALAAVCLIGPRFGLDSARCGEVLFAAVALINPSFRPKGILPNPTQS